MIDPIKLKALLFEMRKKWDFWDDIREKDGKIELHWKDLNENVAWFEKGKLSCTHEQFINVFLGIQEDIIPYFSIPLEKGCHSSKIDWESYRQGWLNGYKVGRYSDPEVVKKDHS